MRLFLEEYAYSNALKNTNTRLKVLFVLSNLVFGVFSTSPVAPFIIFSTMVFLTIFMAKIPARDYFMWFSTPLFFTIPLFLAMIFFFGGTQAWVQFNLFDYKLTIYRDSFNLGLLVVSRVLSGASCLFFLAFTTPMTKLSSAMKLLKVPDIIIELSMLIYRYIFVVLGEATRMELSQRTRLGYTSFKKSLNSLSLLATNVFIRAMDRGEKLHVAMESRCYDGKIKLLEEDSIQKLPMIALITFEGLIFMVMYLTRDMRVV
jgi:cobalt/nickel transport system permease protein